MPVENALGVGPKLPAEGDSEHRLRVGERASLPKGDRPGGLQRRKPILLDASPDNLFGANRERPSRIEKGSEGGIDTRKKRCLPGPVPVVWTDLAVAADPFHPVTVMGPESFSGELFEASDDVVSRRGRSKEKSVDEPRNQASIVGAHDRDTRGAPPGVVFADQPREQFVGALREDRGRGEDERE